MLDWISTQSWFDLGTVSKWVLETCAQLLLAAWWSFLLLCRQAVSLSNRNTDDCIALDLSCFYSIPSRSSPLVWLSLFFQTKVFPCHGALGWCHKICVELCNQDRVATGRQSPMRQNPTKKLRRDMYDAPKIQGDVCRYRFCLAFSNHPFLTSPWRYQTSTRTTNWRPFCRLSHLRGRCANSSHSSLQHEISRRHRGWFLQLHGNFFMYSRLFCRWPFIQPVGSPKKARYIAPVIYTNTSESINMAILREASDRISEILREHRRKVDTGEDPCAMRSTS